MLRNESGKELVSRNFVSCVCDSWDGIATYLPTHTGIWFGKVEAAGKAIAEAVEKFKKTSTKEDYEALKKTADAMVIAGSGFKSNFDQQLSALIKYWETRYVMLTNEDKKEEDSKGLLQRQLNEVTATIKKISEDNHNKVVLLQAEIKSLQTEKEHLAQTAKMYNEQNQELLKSLNKQGSSQVELATGVSAQIVKLTVALAEAKVEVSQKTTELSKMTEELRLARDEAARSIKVLEARIAELEKLAKDMSERYAQAQNSNSFSSSNNRELTGLLRYDRNRSQSQPDVKNWDRNSVLSEGAQSVSIFAAKGETLDARDIRYVRELKYGVNTKFFEVYEILHKRISEKKKDVKHEKAIMAELLYRNARALLASDPANLSIDSVLIELEEKCPVLKETISLVKAEMKAEDNNEIPALPNNKADFKPLGHIMSLTSKGYCEFGDASYLVYEHIKNAQKNIYCLPGKVATQTLEFLKKAEKEEAASKAMPPPLSLITRSRTSSNVNKK